MTMINISGPSNLCTDGLTPSCCCVTVRAKVLLDEHQHRAPGAIQAPLHAISSAARCVPLKNMAFDDACTG